MSQSNCCYDTVKAERVAATNGGRRLIVHRMFTNIRPAFCRENVRCKVKGGSEQQRARCQISHFAHSVPSESCWGVPSPNPAIRSLTAAATSPSGRAFASSIAAQGFENRLSRNRFPQKSFSHRHTQQTTDFCPLKSRKGRTWDKTGG